MKNLFKLLIIFFSATLFAQTEKKEETTREIPTVKMTKGVNLHIVSPEPIQFVDLSTEDLIGDLPTENIARVKVNSKKDSISTKEKIYYTGEDLGIITVVGQSFMAQYKVEYVNNSTHYSQTNIKVQPEDMQPLEFPKQSFSNIELYKFCKKIIEKEDKNPIRTEKDLKLRMKLNNVYVISDYIFLDMGIENESNLSYDIDELKFTLEDKNIYKATNNQSIDLEPIFVFNKEKSFRKNFRNIYVFKKFTYPNSKVLNIRLIEEQLSGRTIEMKVKYSDVLKADTF